MTPGFFFEGAGRRAAMEAILEAADNGASVLCLTGPLGIGRTATLQHLLREADPEVFAVAYVAGDILMSAAQCCAALHACLGEPIQDGDECETLLATFLGVRASGRKPVVLVDDADELGEEALYAVLDVCRNGAATLVLAGDGAVATKAGAAAVIAMPALDEEQCGAFVSAWEEHQDSRRETSRRELSRLYRMSNGIPGVLLPLLEREKFAPTGGFRPGSLPIAHVLFILVALAVLVWLLRDMGHDRAGAAASMREVPIMLPGPAAGASGERPSHGVVGAAVPGPVAVVPRPAPPARTVDVPREDVPSGRVLPVVAPVPAPLEEPRPVPRRYSIDEQALQAEKPSRFTLQLFASFNEQSVRQFVARYAGNGARSFRSVREGLPWYVVVSGSYRTKEDARNAIGRLPAEVQKLKPWPRSLQGIQDELRRRPD